MMHNPHEIVSRVRKRWTFESNARKMIHYIDSSMSLVDKLTLDHEHHIIKQIPDVSRGLVNREDHSFILFMSEFPQQIHNAKRCETVQT